MAAQDTNDDNHSQIRRSPAISPSRPLSIRHLSADLDTYIDMYGLSTGSYNSADVQDGDQQGAIDVNNHDFFFTSDVAQELKNLRTLRRLSLDGAQLDPDVPTQNYEMSPTIQKATEEDDMGNSLYWVPARIHPELAPQEWQSFVQKTGGTLNDDSRGLLRSPSMKSGLTRSRSLLSREVSQKTAERYTDAGPELERRRSRLRPSIRVTDLENLSDHRKDSNHLASLQNSLSELSIEEEPLTTDEPILKPPPGQILRRAARTGKGKGSYRKLGRPKSPPISPSDLSEHDLTLKTAYEGSPQRFESETIQLRDDAPRDTTILSADPEERPNLTHFERKKSKNRTIQVVGPKSPPIMLTSDDQEESFGKDWPIQPAMISNSIESNTSIERPTSETAILPDVFTNPQVSVRSGREEVRDYSEAQPQVIPRIENITRATEPKTESKTPLTEHKLTEGPGTESSSRPMLKREMSAASLTRAVMNGTAPTPAPSANKSPPRRHAEEFDGDYSAAAVPAPAPGKKSAWGKLFSSDDKDRGKPKKDIKSGAKIKRTPSQDDRPTAEKDNASSNLFTSIFGGKKKDKDVSQEYPRRETTPTPTVVREPQFYSRYPIQLERAIYRMAHLKLGNSRRPLAHQVLLSNFMYGYLRKVGINANSSTQGPSRSKANDDRQRKSTQQRVGQSGHDHSKSGPTRPNSSRKQEADDVQSHSPGDAKDAHSSRTTHGEEPVERSDPSLPESRRPQRPGQARSSNSMDVARQQQRDRDESFG